MPKKTLYFAYTSLLDPDRIAEVAPDAEFLVAAYYPETRLSFTRLESGGAATTLAREQGSTVWGGVFEIPGGRVEALVAAEKREGRSPGFDERAVDRRGGKHDCLTFVAAGRDGSERKPPAAELAAMIRGARHWGLPAGWVMSLEDYGEGEPLL